MVCQNACNRLAVAFICIDIVRMIPTVLVLPIRLVERVPCAEGHCLIFNLSILGWGAWRLVLRMSHSADQEADGKNQIHELAHG